MKTAINLKCLSGIFVITILLSITGCKKDGFDKNALNEYLTAMDEVPTASSEGVNSQLKDSSSTMDTYYVYVTKKYSATAGYSDNIVLNPQTEVIFPGALIKGESILDGTYTQISAKRRPITLSTSLTGAGTKVHVTVDDPSLSNVREAVNNLMSNQTFNPPPANIGYEIFQAYSSTQLALSLHAGYKSGAINVVGGLDFSNSNYRTRLVAKFIQKYYTIDLDQPTHPSDLFDEDMDKSTAGTLMPMYVSSVTYGRVALFTVESTMNETDVSGYLHAMYYGGTVEAAAAFTKLQSESKLNVYILGGSSYDAVAAINGFEDFKKYITEGGEFSKDSPGAPIGYTLRFISDNSVGMMKFSADYTIVTAYPRTDNIRYNFSMWLNKILACDADEGGKYVELYGDITAYRKSAGEGASKSFFSRTNSTRFAVPKDGSVSLDEDINTSKLWDGLTIKDTLVTKINITDYDLDQSTTNELYISSHYILIADSLYKAPANEWYDLPKMRVLSSAYPSHYLEFYFKAKYSEYRVEGK